MTTLSDAILEQATPALTRALADRFSLSTDDAHAGFTAIARATIAGLKDYAGDAAVLAGLVDLIEQIDEDDILGAPAAMIENSGQARMTGTDGQIPHQINDQARDQDHQQPGEYARSFFASLYGVRLRGLFDEIADDAGLSARTVAGMMTAAGPIIMAALGRSIRTRQMSIADVAAQLDAETPNAQAPHIMDSGSDASLAADRTADHGDRHADDITPEAPIEVIEAARALSDQRKSERLRERIETSEKKYVALSDTDQPLPGDAGDVDPFTGDGEGVVGLDGEGAPAPGAAGEAVIRPHGYLAGDTANQGDIHTSVDDPDTDDEDEDDDGQGGRMRRAIILAIVVVLGSVIWYFWKKDDDGGARDAQNRTAPAITSPLGAPGLPASLPTAEPAAESGGDRDIDADTTTLAPVPVPGIARVEAEPVGEMLVREFDSGTLRVGASSPEAKLIEFIESDRRPCKHRDCWFTLNELRFNVGSSTLDQRASLPQMERLRQIFRAYPDTRFKIGAYTDNIGDEASNLRLTSARARTVAAEFVMLGISPDRLDYEGFGSERPVANNETPEGRARNRRIAIRLVSRGPFGLPDLADVPDPEDAITGP